MISLKNFKVLKASSIVESVIAIAIISICILVASLTYVNVIKQNKSVNYYKAKHQVELINNDMLIEQNFNNDRYTFKNYSITKDVELNKPENIAFVTYTITIGDKTNVIKKLIPFNETP